MWKMPPPPTGDFGMIIFFQITMVICLIQYSRIVLYTAINGNVYLKSISFKYINKKIFIIIKELKVSKDYYSVLGQLLKTRHEGL